MTAASRASICASSTSRSEKAWGRGENSSAKLRLRVTNDRHIVSFHWSEGAGAGTKDVAWTKYDNQLEVSGYHHNVAGDFLSLRPGIYVAGAGEARFSNLRFRALTQGSSAR